VRFNDSSEQLQSVTLQGAQLHNAEVNAGCFVEPDTRMFGTTAYELLLVDFAKTHTPVQVIQRDLNAEQNALCTHPQVGGRFAVGDQYGRILFYHSVCSASPYQIQLTADVKATPGINALHWDPLGQLIAVGCDDGTCGLVLTIGWESASAQ